TTVLKGAVIDSSPAVGSSQEKGTLVTLRVSTGPPQVAVPQIAGLTLPEATAALAKAQFTVAPNPARAASTPELVDRVVDSTPKSGAPADLNGTVTLVLGSGPVQVPIPQVVGLDQASAQGNLKQLQFASTVESADSSSPQGRVIAQNPTAGGNASQGSSVTLTVSRGNRVSMPKLVGLTPTAAQAALDAAGWKGGAGGFSSTDVPVPDPAQQNLVQTQSVPVGRDIGTTTPIVVTTGSFQAPVTTAPPVTTPPPVKCPIPGIGLPPGCIP
ncbi:MAG: PASTA domain-containing protein, partial [Mycobacteriaceae bacterium]